MKQKSIIPTFKTIGPRISEKNKDKAALKCE